MASAFGSRATLARKLVPRSSMQASLAQPLRGVERRRNDRHIAGAAAQVTAEKLPHVAFSRIGTRAQIPVERHQNSGGAKAALQRVMAPERLLQHGQPARAKLQSLDRA